MFEEMDVLKIVRSMRFFDVAIAHLLNNDKEYKNLREETRYVSVFPYEDDLDNGNDKKVWSEDIQI